VTDIEPFGLVILVILVIGLVGTAAVLSNRLSERLRVPAPAFFLVFAAAASDLFPNLARVSGSTVQHVVTIALAERRPAGAPGRLAARTDGDHTGT
jgi:cell volume regulation protein A